jgi:TonB family protein
MSRIERMIRTITLPPARKAALCLGLACAGAGCAPLAQAQDDSGGVTQKAIANFASCAKPIYPKPDLRAGHQGAVTLDFRIATDGSVTESKVGQSSGFPGLDEAARLAIEKCQFKPAMKDGQPVDAWTKVKYVWSLK